MTQRMLISAVFGGVIAGAVAAALQFWLVIPSLLEGELYETGARIHFGTDGSPESVSGAPGLGTDWARHSMTVAFNMVTYTGYGLLLAALMMIAAGRGAVLNLRSGLIWGMAGFFAVQLAPAVGLPPELPGTIAPDVGARQIWWAMTIILSAGGIALIAFGSGLMTLVGAVLLAVPHVIGAPHLDTYFGVAPPELAAHFVMLSMGAAAGGWVLLGGVVGHFMGQE